MKPPYRQRSVASASESEASPPCEDTPSTNRGVGISAGLTVSPHWLSATLHGSLSELVESYFECFLKLPDLSWEEVCATWFRPLEYSRYGYRGAWVCRDGMEVYAFPSTGQHCLLVMSGSVIEKYPKDSLLRFLATHLDEEEVYDFLNGGDRPRLNISRFDVAIDNCPFTPRQVFDAQDAGNYRSKARPGAWYPDTGDGSTAYHGSRKSDKLLRVYDRRGPTRCELEYRRKAALALCTLYAYSEQTDVVERVIGVLRDLVDFVDRRSNVSESPLLPWWELFVGSTGREALPSGYKEPDSIVRLRGYVKRVAPSIKALLHYEQISPESFFQTVELGKRQVSLLTSVGRWESSESDVPD